MKIKVQPTMTIKTKLPTKVTSGMTIEKLRTIITMKATMKIAMNNVHYDDDDDEEREDSEQGVITTVAMEVIL